jgi:hypothetical protein
MSTKNDLPDYLIRMLQEFHSRYNKATVNYTHKQEYYEICYCKLYVNDILLSKSTASTSSYLNSKIIATEEALNQIGIYKPPPTKEDILNESIKILNTKIDRFRYRKLSLIERLWGEREPRYTYKEWKALKELEESIGSLRNDYK